MIGMRWTQAMLAATLLVWLATTARGQEPTKDPEAPKPETPPAAATDATPANPPWWGGRNLLYLEFAYGADSIEAIDAGYATDNSSIADNRFEVTDAVRGRLAVGWTLPNDRGRYLFAFEGVAEDGYRLDSTGNLLQVAGSGTNQPPTAPVRWWNLTIDNGNVAADRNPPYWEFFDDANSNQRADPSEVRYLGSDIVTSSVGPSDMRNRFQTYDLLYQREFGGRRIWGNWSAGLRHFVYDGNIPTGAWLVSLGAQGPGGVFFSDGTFTPIIVFTQETRGTGPTGSAGLNFGFARRRLVLYAEARFSFLLQNLETDSGDIVTYAYDNNQSSFYPVPTRLQKSFSKSIWQVQAEIGARLRILERTHLLLSYRRAGYMDSLAVPVSIVAPDSPAQANQNATAQFNSRDIRTDVLTLGLSYQF